MKNYAPAKTFSEKVETYFNKNVKKSRLPKAVRVNAFNQLRHQFQTCEYHNSGAYGSIPTVRGRLDVPSQG